MKKEFVKQNKINKCDYCDELATYKILKDNDISEYICTSCYNAKILKK